MRKLAALAVAVATLGWAGGAAAEVTGRVAFEGQPAQQGRLRMGADPVCARLHQAPVYDNEVVVNENGTLKNVIVYVKEGLHDRAFDPPAQPVVLDQRGCVYTPRAVAVQVGQPLVFLNSDPTLHNVHSLSRANRQFNIGQPVQGMKVPRTFDKPEFIRMKCDVHPWMNAVVGVFAHPFAAVTGEDGSFRLPGLPAGEYTLEAWHERYGTQTMKVTVSAGEAKTVEFRFRG